MPSTTAPHDPARRSPSRRRQRSVRVSLAVGLLGLATVLVLAALPTQSPLLLSLASVGAVALSWAALRMMWTEVLQSRRENARDRVATASAYRALFSHRAEEHAEFTTAMTSRLAESHLLLRETQGTLGSTQALLVGAEARAHAEAGRVLTLQEHVHALEGELGAARIEVEVARVGAEGAEIVAATARESLAALEERVLELAAVAAEPVVALVVVDDVEPESHEAPEAPAAERDLELFLRARRPEADAAELATWDSERMRTRVLAKKARKAGSETA